MAAGCKTGGRKKGTPNKEKQALRERLETLYPDYDPILAMAEMAMDDSLELAMRLDCHKTIANYIHPKMKAVEHLGEEEESPPFTITVVPREPVEPVRITRGVAVEE